MPVASCRNTWTRRKAAIFKDDPFQTLDIAGVGMLIEWGIARGRKTRPKLKIGICGEHGGDSESVKFCHQRGHGLRQRLAVPRAHCATGCSASRN